MNAAWAVLFVIGVILNCCAVWGAPSPWFARIGWLCWAIAAILWLGPSFAAVGPRCTRLFC